MPKESNHLTSVFSSLPNLLLQPPVISFVKHYFPCKLFPPTIFTPAKAFNQCYSTMRWLIFAFTYEFKISAKNRDKSENILVSQLKDVLYFNLRWVWIFFRNLPYLEVTSKLSTPEICIKNPCLFTFSKTT